jgi:hypothetical protein
MGMAKGRRKRSARSEDKEEGDQVIKEGIEEIEEREISKFFERVDESSNTYSVANEVLGNDRMDVTLNAGSGSERSQESNEAVSKVEQKTNESVSQDEEIKDIADIIDELKDNPILQSIIPNWQSWLSSLGDPRLWFLTKEDYMLIKSYLTLLDANTYANILEQIRLRSNDPCEVDRLIQFIVIKKIGSALIQSHKNRLDSIIKAIEIQGNMYISAINQLGIIANSMANAHKLMAGLSNFEIPNIALDIKLASLIATVISAITAVGIEIGNLKNNLRTLINLNEYCIRACRSGCGGSVILSSNPSIENLAKEGSEYNEGVEFAKESELVLRRIEELIKLELEYIKRKLEEDFNNKRRKNKNNES